MELYWFHTLDHFSHRHLRACRTVVGLSRAAVVLRCGGHRCHPRDDSRGVFPPACCRHREAGSRHNRTHRGPPLLALATALGLTLARLRGSRGLQVASACELPRGEVRQPRQSPGCLWERRGRGRRGARGGVGRDIGFQLFRQKKRRAGIFPYCPSTPF